MLQRHHYFTNEPSLLVRGVPEGRMLPNMHPRVGAKRQAAGRDWKRFVKKTRPWTFLDLDLGNPELRTASIYEIVRY